MDAEQLPVVKVEMVGDVTSFRYALISHGFQPTYEMPPPSTIYGHICSAFGRYLREEEISQLRFGYRFSHSGKFIDYMEHLHFDDPVQPLPFNRELLFQPRLTLYLAGLDVFEAFRSPHYMVVIGRSQDLMTYAAVERKSLVRAKQGFFDRALLPSWVAPHLSRNVTVATMARYIDPARRPQWQSYALLQDTAPWPPDASRQGSWMDDDEDLIFEQDTPSFDLWVDPSETHHRYPGLHRAVWLHSFLAETS
jgi:CRISPR-associated protein Cas5t